MNSGIYTFARNNPHIPDNSIDKFGVRGSLLVRMSELELPISPGFLIDSDSFGNLDAVDLPKMIKDGINFIEKVSYKDFNGGSVPLTVKIVLSSSVDIDTLPSIHNIGLNNQTIDNFAEIGGKDFAYGEYKYILKSFAEHYSGVSESSIKKIEASGNDKEACKAYLDLLGDKYPQNSYDLLELLIRKFQKNYFADELNKDVPCSILIQMMVYGSFGNNSFNGEYFTRDIATGEPVINGFYGNDEMFTKSDAGNDIKQIDKVYFNELNRISQIIEAHFIDIKYIRFTIERGILWLVSIFHSDQKSTRSEIRMLLDLHEKKIIDDKYVISKIIPNQLNDLLHSTVDAESKKKLTFIQGGLAGSPGACMGKVFFSTKKLMDAYRDSSVKGEDCRFILAMKSTYAGDVQAIEIGEGVISSEGGYASHAPVVARSIGKPAIVNPSIEFTADSMKIGDIVIREGDYVSMEVNNYSDPIIYLGQVTLQPPDMQNNRVFDLMDIINKHIGTFSVRANADNKKDATLAKNLGASGIGLCRTEHMFFEEKRINIFREILITEDEKKTQAILDELKAFQTEDFIGLFEAMDGNPISIRLLDAPLHEFIPYSIDQKEYFNASYQKRGGKLNPIEIKTHFDRLKEVNPMLGHRGCRIAISFFNIYKMQIEAIFEAAYTCAQKKLSPKPEILIPMVMTDEELKHIIYGKDIQEDCVIGISGIEEQFINKYKLTEMPFEHRIGAMIELPAAALNSGDLAKHASFFSYGTNDLTQTTHGLSRDDINAFLPSYTKFDILHNNPFQILTNEVKSLINYSSVTGRIVRPDLKLGLCGEHGANEENIQFCIANNLNYVSCSPYGVPIALLSVARHQINQ